MSHPPAHIKLMIVEERCIVLHALVALCSTFKNMEVVAAACNGAELAQLLETARPDIVIAGIQALFRDGLEPARASNEKMPWSRVISLSVYDHPAYVKKLLKLGVRGFISKNASENELEKAILSVFNGEIYLSEEISRSVLKDFSDPTGPDVINNYNSLTFREIQIIQLLSDGCYTREIAEKLFISPKTVERHKTNILKKLSLRNTAHLVKMAIQNNIIVT